MTIILFKSRELIYGIETEYIEEIIRMVKLTSLPSDNGKAHALVNYRGQTIQVADICNYFEKKSGTYTKDNIIIVVKYNNEFIGILTEDVVDIVSSDTGQISWGENKEMLCFKGSLQIESKIYPVLNVKTIINDINVFNPK